MTSQYCTKAGALLLSLVKLNWGEVLVVSLGEEKKTQDLDSKR